MNTNTPHFESAQHALTWATEVLRRRRFPSVSALYKEMLTQAKTPAGLNATHRWFGEYGNLPTTREDKLAWVLEIYQQLDTLPEDMQKILRLRYWGDYVNERRLRSALALQDKLRVTEGIRVKLSWRYPFRQVATLLNMSKPSVHRKENEGLTQLEREPIHARLLNITPLSSKISPTMP